MVRWLANFIFCSSHSLAGTKCPLDHHLNRIDSNSKEVRLSLTFFVSACPSPYVRRNPGAVPSPVPLQLPSAHGLELRWTAWLSTAPRATHLTSPMSCSTKCKQNLLNLNITQCKHNKKGFKKCTFWVFRAFTVEHILLQIQCKKNQSKENKDKIP